MNIDNAVFTLDTKWVVSGDYTADVIRFGHHRFETPIFDSLAADRFASDRYNLGDYR
jgi:hypothetical protein